MGGGSVLRGHEVGLLNGWVVPWWASLLGERGALFGMFDNDTFDIRREG